MQNKKDLAITEDWLDNSLNNSEAIDRYIQLEADGAKIVGGSWDQPDELESLGIGGEGGEEKGFSTDMVVRDSKGKNPQISLKKDGNVNFLNSELDNTQSITSLVLRKIHQTLL